MLNRNSKSTRVRPRRSDGAGSNLYSRRDQIATLLLVTKKFLTEQTMIAFAQHPYIAG